MKIKLFGFDKAMTVGQVPRKQHSSGRMTTVTTAQKVSSLIQTESLMDLTEDIRDVGILAFTLLNDVTDYSDLISV
jgi:hypothetical protein